MSKALEDIAAERAHQIGKGYGPEWDDQYLQGELAQAAASFALRSHISPSGMSKGETGDTPMWAGLSCRGPLRAELNAGWIGLGNLVWPWSRRDGYGYTFPFHDDRRTRLIKAAALIVAEIERLDRAAKAEGKPE